MVCGPNALLFVQHGVHAIAGLLPRFAQQSDALGAGGFGTNGFNAGENHAQGREAHALGIFDEGVQFPLPAPLVEPGDEVVVQRTVAAFEGGEEEVGAVHGLYFSIVQESGI